MGGSGLVAISLLLLVYAGVSRRLSASVITAAMVFVAGGVLVSDEGLGWLDPTIDSESVRLVAEATLAVVLFSDASRIDLAALRREYVLPLRLLAIGLPLTIVAGLSLVLPYSESSYSSRRSCSRSCSPRPTLPLGRRSSPTHGFLHVFVRDSTSRAGSTTGSACRSS